MDIFVMGQNKVFYDYPAHSHDLWEILINIKGDGTAVIDGKPCPFHPGTIFCLRPGTMHAKQAQDGFVDGGFLMSDFCFKNLPGNVFVFQDDAQQSIYTLYKLAFQYPFNPSTDVYGERFIRSILDAIQNLLSHWMDDTGKSRDVLMVRKALLDHVADSAFDLEALLAQTSYTPNHFRKLFREQCGCSPLQYYHQLKIQLAKQLLLQHHSVLSISEIARSCGFEDPYYFSRVFKKNKNLIILSAVFNLEEANAKELKDLVSERMKKRIASQPLEKPTAGSVFKNPGDLAAGKLIEDAGLKGKTIGGAKVSEKHANFIINEGNATGEDIKRLVEFIKEEVEDKYNIKLETEQEFINF